MTFNFNFNLNLERIKEKCILFLFQSIIIVIPILSEYYPFRQNCYIRMKYFSLCSTIDFKETEKKLLSIKMNFFHDAAVLIPFLFSFLIETKNTLASLVFNYNYNHVTFLFGLFETNRCINDIISKPTQKLQSFFLREQLEN